MTRTRYWDYESDDATSLFNGWFRGALQPGVYHGFDAVQGSSGLNVTLQMASDPSYAGAKLGKLVTTSGVTISETADLTDVATGYAGHVSDLRVDYLVATYVYNASLPANDVTYEVLMGTAGDPPTPPTLTDHQTLIAEIWMPAGAASILTSYIRNVRKKDLHAEELDLDDLLRDGPYSGYTIKEGTAVNKISLTAGVARTPEKVTVSDSSAQTDLFTITNTTSADHYRYDSLVLLHKKGDNAAAPHDFLIVEGSEADESAGAVATIPSNSDILTAATAYDGKYVSQDHITKLGYIRVQGIGAAMTAEYHHYPRMIQDISWYVSAGKVDAAEQLLPPLAQVWPYTGHEGLVSVLALAQAVINSYYEGADNFYLQGERLRILVDGDFHFPPTTLVGIPSYVSLEGLSSTTMRFPADDTIPLSILMGGFTVASPDTGANKIDVRGSADGVSQTNVPGGYERVEIDIKSATDKDVFVNNPNGLENFLFAGHYSAGDPIRYVYNGASGLQEYVGWFESYTTSVISNDEWTFSAILVDDTAGGGGADWANDFVQLAIFKRNNALKNLQVLQTRTVSDLSKGALSIRACDGGGIDNLRVPHIDTSVYTRNLHVRALEVHTHGWDEEVLPSTTYETNGYGNEYEKLVFKPTRANASVSFGGDGSNSGVGETDCHVGSLLFDGGFGLDYGSLLVDLTDSRIDQLVVKSISSDVSLGGKHLSCGTVSVNRRSDVTPVDLLFGGERNAAKLVTVYGGSFVWDTDAAECLVDSAVYTAIVDSSTTQDSLIAYDELRRIPQQYISTILDDFFEESPLYDFPNEIVVLNSGGLLLNYAASTGWFTYSGAIDLSNVRIGDALQDSTGRRLRILEVDDTLNRVRLDRGLTVSSTSTDVYDGSIARGNAVFRNDSQASFTYDAATGVIQYGATVDLSHIKVGYLFRDGAGSYFEISAVNDGLNRVTLEVGVTVDNTVASSLDGSIEANNNPRDLSLNDCYTLYGVEDIPYSKVYIKRGRTRKGLKARYDYIEWDDQRVAVQGLPDLAEGYSARRISSSLDGAAVISTSIVALEVTGFMTGVAIGTPGQTTPPTPTLYVDGAQVLAGSQPFSSRISETDAWGRARGRVYSNSTILNLPAGVHTVRISVSASVDITHVYLINSQGDDGQFLDAPGRLWYEGSYYDHEQGSPGAYALTSGRGGRVMRYAPDSDPRTRSFAYTNLPEFATTGVTNNPVDNVLLNVAALGDLEGGDLLMIEEVGVERELHCIASVTAPSTITLVSSLGVAFGAGSAITITYKGKSIRNDDEWTIHDAYEEVDNVYTLADLTDDNLGNPVSPSRQAVAGANGLDLMDGMSYIGMQSLYLTGDLSSECEFSVVGRDSSFATGNYLRFGFIGSGADLYCLTAFAGSLDIYVDGVLLEASYSFSAGTGFLWLPIVAELDYGFHVIDLVGPSSGGAGVFVRAIRTYRPKDPTISGKAVMAFNVLGDYAAPWIDDQIETPSGGVLQFGTETLVNDEAASYGDFAYTVGAAHSVRRGERILENASGLSAGYLYFWFFGDAISLIINSTAGYSASAATVQVLDKDGTFRVPSALTGLVVTGNDTINMGAGSFQRVSWTFDEVGFHCLRCNYWNDNTGPGPGTGGALVAYEVHQPIFSPERYTKELTLSGHNKLLASSRDYRATQALDRGQRNYGGAIALRDKSISGADATNEYAVPINSRGGIYEIKFTANVAWAANTLGGYVYAYFTFASKNDVMAQISAIDTTRKHSLSLSTTVQLPRGLTPCGVTVTRSNTTDTLNITEGAISWREVAHYDEEEYGDSRQRLVTVGLP